MGGQRDRPSEKCLAGGALIARIPCSVVTERAPWALRVCAIVAKTRPALASCHIAALPLLESVFWTRADKRSAILNSKRARIGRLRVSTSRTRCQIGVRVGVFSALGAGSVVSCVAGPNVTRAAIDARSRTEVLPSSTRRTGGFGFVADL